METITATITYPLESIEAFADRLGYNTAIINPDFEDTTSDTDTEATTNGEPQTVPNPEDRVAFVKRKFKEQAVGYFTQFSLSEANKLGTAAKKEVEDTYMGTAKAQVEAAITV